MPELDKYIKHYGLKQHLKNSKNEKVKVIVRHCLQQRSPRMTTQTGVRVYQNESRGDAIESAEGEEEYGSVFIDPEEEDESNNAVPAFIAADEEDTDEQPLTTCLGPEITKRSEIDFSFF